MQNDQYNFVCTSIYSSILYKDTLTKEEGASLVVEIDIPH